MILNQNFFWQRKLAAIVDITHCLYYVDVLDPTFCDLEMLAFLSNKAMESVQKEHMIAFHKRLHVCEPTLGIEFLQQIQVHYNMNPNLEI